MRKRKRYNEEFKLQALKRVDEPGVTAALVAEELGISWRESTRGIFSVQCNTQCVTPTK